MKKCPYCAEEIQDEAIVCKHCGRDLPTPSKSAPISTQQQSSPQRTPKRNNSVIIMMVLVGLVGVLCICLGLASLSGSETSTTQNNGQSTYSLELLAMNDERAYDYITVSGQVKNISGGNLDNVTAVVTFLDANGNFVKTDSALIDYNPILDGQTSPFSVITTDNPAIKQYNITFKHLLGGTISMKDSR